MMGISQDTLRKIRDWRARTTDTQERPSGCTLGTCRLMKLRPIKHMQAAAPGRQWHRAIGAPLPRMADEVTNRWNIPRPACR
jgi:hypothetical protein